MSSEEVISMCTTALWAILKMSSPVMIIAMVVGLVVALFQAMTQVQEMTLTFVPKIIAIFIGLIVYATFMGDILFDLGGQIFNQIVQIK